ncbi:MAG: hypothetical protein AAF543_04355 [Pseudomonadota bacterium]
MGILNAAAGAVKGAVDGFTGGGGEGGTGVNGPDFGKLAETFNKATEDTLKITEIKTVGDVAKDAARQRPS